MVFRINFTLKVILFWINQFISLIHGNNFIISGRQSDDLRWIQMKSFSFVWSIWGWMNLIVMNSLSCRLSLRYLFAIQKYSITKCDRYFLFVAMLLKFVPWSQYYYYFFVIWNEFFICEFFYICQFPFRHSNLTI